MTVPNLPQSRSGTLQLFSIQHQRLSGSHSASALLLLDPHWADRCEYVGLQGLLHPFQTQGQGTLHCENASAQQKKVRKHSKDGRSSEDRRRVLFCCHAWQPRTPTCIDPSPPQKSPSPSAKYSLKEKLSNGQGRRARQRLDNTGNVNTTKARPLLHLGKKAMHS